MQEAGVLNPRLNRKQSATPPAASRASCAFSGSRSAGFLFSLFLLLFGATAGRCDGLSEFLNPYQLPVRGLSLAPQSADPALIWTLNVGLLNDSELPELTVADVRPLLEEITARLGPLLPGVTVRFIIDQPMNSVFLIERSVRKKGFLGPKYDEDGTVLLLGSGAANADQNRARLRAVGGYSPTRIERELAQLAKWNRQGCVSEKLPASEYVWRAYLAGQVRYDLVLSNALIYADDLNVRARPTGDPLVLWDVESPFVRQAIVPMNGRSALEGHGALVSLFGFQAADSSSPATVNPGECLNVSPALGRVSYAESMARAVFQLLRPADFSQLAGGRASPGMSPDEYLRRCGAECEAAWRKRRRYLTTMVELEAGVRDGACDRLEDTYAEYGPGADSDSKLDPGFRTLNAERAESHSGNRTKFRRLCGKNG